jgi:hypothetical protein
MGEACDVEGDAEAGEGGVYSLVRYLRRLLVGKKLGWEGGRT